MAAVHIHLKLLCEAFDVLKHQSCYFSILKLHFCGLCSRINGRFVKSLTVAFFNCVMHPARHREFEQGAPLLLPDRVTEGIIGSLPDHGSTDFFT